MDEADGAIIVLHTLGRTREDMLEFALPLRDRFSLVFIDLRGHGESDGEFFTYGYHEWQDVATAVDFLRTKEPNCDVSVLGASAGGAVAIQAAAKDTRISTVVAIASFADLRRTIERQTAFLPDFWRNRTIGKAERLARFSVDGASPVNAITTLNCPILLIHGSEDAYIPYRNAIALKDAAPDDTLLSLDGVRHATMFQDAELLRGRIVGFIFQ